MSEANAPLDSANQPESNQPEVNPLESKVRSASSGRPKAFSELKALTDLTPDGAETAAGPSPSLSQDDEIELDISKIFDASDLDGLAFEAEAVQSELTAELGLPDLTEIDLELDSGVDPWADPDVFSFPSAANPLEGHFAVEAPTVEAPTVEAPAVEAPAVEVPSLASLIGLIQELNQCNGVLMDRVSQLEEALESSQSALQAEVGRVHDTEIGQDWNNSQDWATVQDQVANLFNQLEFAHQTNQRQQILIETLTSQLENSQERVAQLEREAALIQQRYDEQAQLLVKSEHTNRDLQARLQRQQRYTLQFKVALERSLEVAAPSYEANLYEVSPESRPVALEAAETLQFLPKAKQIQPWSAQSQLPLNQSTWMKLQSSLSSLAEATLTGSSLTEPSLAESNLLPPDQAEAGFRFSTTPEPRSEAAQAQEAPATAHLHLPAFGMPLLQFADAGDVLPAAASQNAVPQNAVPQNAVPQNAVLQNTALPDGHSLSGSSGPALSDPMLNQLDEVVKPLADMLAEAMLAGTANPSAPPSQPVQPASQPNSSPEMISVPEANELLASVMADAEDALWQDLARLIDVSTEDVVKASLSGDLAAFESIDFAALNPAAARSEAPAPTETPTPTETSAQTAAQFNWRTDAPPSANQADAAAVAPLLRRQSPVNQSGNQPGNQLNNQLNNQPASSLAAAQEEPDLADAQALDVQALDAQTSEPTALVPGSWPSPVVYPLRPVKKRQSLAMVDLPTFPRS